ncbi:polyprenyl synthetase family protein [Alloprevotella rava]|uniref:Geranylgeranyl diphosphate synthase type II n=1 Tax=Alloprevotella rava TaxID=671218 RepID=A0A7W5UJB1_9BACT|nr:polyprenyl synthetase family protein [Alloprevotella rava]MBB3702411.1 geranylgeranyl diphosphate synthase type II [Alloprevotella rava]
METILNKIEAALAAIPYPQQPEGLYEPIRYVLSMGGKRLRPTLTLMAYALYKEDTERALPTAIGLETYHNHTLLHDDLMDKADMRRGKATVHKKWDENTAILSGDTMLIMAFQHILHTDCHRLPEVLNLAARTMQEICEGQQYDINFENRNDVREEEYIEMIRLKTSVLLACALKAGALIADAPKEDCELLYQFGEKIGLAFQLQDDYLDCYGDPAVFGKQIGGDICCAKKTFMLINAFNRANDAQKAEINRLLNEVDEREEKVAGVLTLYDELEIPALCHERMETLYAEARRIFDCLPIAAERKQPLWDYAEKLLSRKK